MIIRWLTLLAHKFDIHYAPVFGPILGHEDGKPHYQRWCQWCGLREDYAYDPRKPLTMDDFIAMYGRGSFQMLICVCTHKEHGHANGLKCSRCMCEKFVEREGQ